MRWTTRCIAACWLAAASAAGPAAPPARAATAAAASAGGLAPACVSCHPSASAILSGAMASRKGEHAFAARAFGAHGERFFAQSCTGCHVSTCGDCHGPAPHAARARPGSEACLRCHRGYFVGWEYLGRAPREDHARYQRGPEANGERYLKMLPDVHAEAGMSCAECHTMRSLQQGRRTARTCAECHPAVSREVPEHAIAAHLERLECSACHSAWAAQEYGTFLVRGGTPEQQEVFEAALPRWGEWRKSAYLKRQDAPPLGLNERGKVSPIRPQFVLFASDPRQGLENRLLLAEWRAFFPHTVRRGTVTCAGCHENPARYLLERDEDRHYLLERDGLPLRSFWSQAGQRVANGAFLDRARHDRMNRKTPEYVRQYLRQWKNLLDPAARPSSR